MPEQTSVIGYRGRAATVPAMKKILVTAATLLTALVAASPARAGSLDGVETVTGYATIEKKGSYEIRLALLSGASHLSGHSVAARVPSNAAIGEEDVRNATAQRKISYSDLRTGDVVKVALTFQPRSSGSATSCPFKDTVSRLTCENGQSVGSYYRVNLTEAVRQNGSRCLTMKGVKTLGVAKTPRRNATLCLRPNGPGTVAVSGYVSGTDGVVPGSVEADLDINTANGVLANVVKLAPGPSATEITVSAVASGTRLWTVLRWDPTPAEIGVQSSREYAFRVG